MSHRFDPRAVVCPRCGAAPGKPCVDVTRSYRRGRPLFHCHAERRRKAKARTATPGPSAPETTGAKPPSEESP